MKQQIKCPHCNKLFPLEESLKHETEDISVNADRKRIAQVLTNLLNNSISYGKEDGNTTISVFVVDDLVTIEVSDDGIGIDKAHFPRLFERFYRVEKSRNRHEGGTGLGLAIVKHVIDSHPVSYTHLTLPTKDGG